MGKLKSFGVSVRDWWVTAGWSLFRFNRMLEFGRDVVTCRASERLSR